MTAFNIKFIKTYEAVKTFQLLRYRPGNILNIKVTTARPTVKLSYTMTMHPPPPPPHHHQCPLTNVPTKYKLPIPYSF